MGSPQQYSGLARSLLEASQLTAQQLDQAVTQAAQESKPLSRVLVERQFLSSEQLTQFCKQTYHLPVFDLSNIQPNALPPQYLSMDLIERHCALPLFLKNNILYLALSDPTNMTALDDFSFRFNLITDAQLVDEAQLSLLLKQLQQGEDNHLVDLEQIETDDLQHLTLTDDTTQSTLGSQDDDAPIVRYIYKIMLEAVNCLASDIHFEPYERFYRIRFRIDGLLHDFASAPISYANRFAARLKVMAQLDISERRLPQDGRMKLQLPHHTTIDMRISSLPIQAGEKIVLRLLDSSAIKLDINQLGFNERQKQQYLTALNQSQGMILATGPTGSGKTVSLYTGLSILNTVSTNISTAEDPVEIIMPGINQLQVNPKIGLSFAHALRAFLRQDPDIIMVGEIRDLETAEIAVKAAQTGHLVLSTLHTNSATETLTRLSNMGLAAYNIASSVNLIIAQRLARKLCPHCKEPELLNEQQLVQLAIDEDSAQTQTIYHANGCTLCTDGYKGRTGVYEVLPMNDTLADLIINGADSLTLARAAQSAGLLTLRQSALNKVQAGIISLAEANRITDQ